MEAAKFATLVSFKSGAYCVSFVPAMVKQVSEQLYLEAHVARANCHWQAADGGLETVAIFHGGEGYVSPGWYPSKKATGKAVPTLTYIMIEAKGELTAIEDAGWLRAHVDELSERHEHARAEPWRSADAPPGYIDKLLHSIVGLRLDVRSLEGSWKLNQHRSAQDCAGMVAGLKADRADERLIAALEAALS
jgi:transcriptional regulator